LRPVRRRHILTQILTKDLTQHLTFMSFHFRGLPVKASEQIRLRLTVLSDRQDSHVGDWLGEQPGEYVGEYLIFSIPLFIGLSALLGEYGEGFFKSATKRNNAILHAVVS
jgi:hypothetical protein